MTYKRKIYIGNQDYSRRVNSCTFNWVRDGGAVSANLTIESAAFDSYEGVEIGEVVDIRYDSSIASRCFYGSVAEMKSTLEGGLAISAVGGKVKLGEIYPLGRFGTKVQVETPTGLSYLVTEVGGELTAGTYTYQVSAVDATGETLASSSVAAAVVGSEGMVDLSWDAVEGATGYRVYRGTANPWAYWETSEVAFNDDGTSSGTAIGALPASDTAESPTIASEFVDDVINHLLTTYLPADIDVGDITAGTTFALDDYDLQDGSASLADVLDALADIVGDTVWGVDEQGEVYFVALPTSYDYTFRIGVDGATENNVTDASRQRSRDGVTAVRVVGEDALNDPSVENKLSARTNPSEDWPEPKSAAGSVWWRGANYRFTSKVSASTAKITAASTFLTGAYSGATQTAVELVPEIAAIKRVALSWNGSSYDIEPPYTEAIIARQLEGINSRIQKLWDLRGRNAGSFENMTRRKPAARYIAGVKSAALSKIAATNFTLKYTPVPDVWNITIENFQDLIKPGVHMIRLITQFGKSYDLHVQSADYSFEDIPIVSLVCGDPVYDEEAEVEDVKKVVQRMASRTFSNNKWFPYVG